MNGPKFSEHHQRKSIAKVGALGIARGLGQLPFCLGKGRFLDARQSHNTLVSGDSPPIHIPYTLSSWISSVRSNRQPSHPQPRNDLSLRLLALVAMWVIGDSLSRREGAGSLGVGCISAMATAVLPSLSLSIRVWRQTTVSTTEPLRPQSVGPGTDVQC